MFSFEINKVLSKRSVFEKDLSSSEKFLSIFISENNIINSASQFVINNGKRIRSILYFSFFKECAKFQINEKLKYKTSAIIEIVHFASIIHDDIIDNNMFRRNNESFFKKYGKKKSILVGDYILIKAFNEFFKLHDEEFIKRMFIRECSATAYGALLEQQMTIFSSFEEYLRMISLKTSPLFKLSCFLGSYLSSNNFESSKKAAISGISFGILFQAQNDINGYKFKNFEDSEDYVQKNISLPLIIIRDYFGYDSRKFYNTSQENYQEIKDLITSKRFEVITLELFSKYKKNINLIE